ncbi:MAG: RnfH family protein [Gammaproteobacteria bacterium]|nr:RnfH family protein [Gammaproteobacteria bacterium]
MENADKIEVEVSYARPDVQVIIPVKADASATVEEVIRLSGVLEQFPDIDLAVNKVGVFGKLSKLSAQLMPGDRVEIYRALIADPKESRRQRAAEGKEAPKAPT